MQFVRKALIKKVQKKRIKKRKKRIQKINDKEVAVGGFSPPIWQRSIMNIKLLAIMKSILTALRVSHFLSASQMARKIEVSPSYISKLESGEKLPTDSIIKKYSKAFHISEKTIRMFDERTKKTKREMDNQEVLLMVLNEMIKNKK